MKLLQPTYPGSVTRHTRHPIFAPPYLRVQGVSVARARVHGPDGDRLAGGTRVGSPWRARWKEDDSAYPPGTWGTSTSEYKTGHKRGSPAIPAVGAPPPRAPPPPSLAPAPSPIAPTIEPGPRPATAPASMDRPATDRPTSVVGMRDIQSTTSADIMYSVSYRVDEVGSWAALRRPPRRGLHWSHCMLSPIDIYPNTAAHHRPRINFTTRVRLTTRSMHDLPRASGKIW